ncbi:MAG: S9 family peptidase [Proteobacteria bacterium]|nr:S9 family peptidase [Pseudomonadota bacterium]
MASTKTNTAEDERDSGEESEGPLVDQVLAAERRRHAKPVGGGEFGEEWHEAGMKMNKQNVFNDFIAAAEWLIAERYTSSEKLAIFGWSNGGLLTATVLTQRPELFKAVVIGAPVIDMLRYHLFFGGRHWIPDYGDPDDPEMLRYLLTYSPYPNIHDGTEYPATILVTADKDDRVHPMHGFKMIARLQAANSSESPILARIETKSGHGGAAAISNVVEQYSDMWSFVFWQLGMER